MSSFLFATIKSWNIENYQKIRETYPEYKFEIITEKEELTVQILDEFQPDYIFFPHWSWFIPAEIYENYNCVVFHMTDLPFGRGGSPLQNLLVRGIYNTKISAIKVCDGIDTGPVYLKESIDISEGTADQIYRNVSDIIFSRMIPRFFEEELYPEKQIGEVVSFNRRTPEESEIPDGLSQRQIYDYIRMLDGEGYPAAFKRYDKGKILYTDANFEDGVVVARAQFVNDKED